jgi:hypothetical protein
MSALFIAAFSVGRALVRTGAGVLGDRIDPLVAVAMARDLAAEVPVRVIPVAAA